MKDLFEEMKELELNEDIPKDLAKAFKNSFDQPRDANQNELGYSSNYKNIKRRPNIDFKNSTYTEISPEEALQLYKSGNSRNVLAIIKGSLANTYFTTDENGVKRRTYDYKASVGGLEKKNGKRVENSMQLSPEEFYNNADKIYLANEVEVDPALRAERAKNPESRYNNSRFNKPIRKPSPINGINANLNLIDIKDDTARYRSMYVQDLAVNDPSGNSMRLDRDKYYPLDVWKQVYSKFSSKWSESDADVSSAKYIVDKLSGADKSSKGDPRAYDWRGYDYDKKIKAETRYADVQKALQDTLNKGRNIVNQISAEKQNLLSAQSDRTYFADPARVEDSKRNIKNRISSMQSNINYYMRELLKLQDSLDDVDANNQKQIDAYDKKIADIQDNIANLQSQMRGLYKKNKVGEGLNEDLNIIQFTNEDQAQNIRSLIKNCWDNVEQYSMYAQQLRDFGSIQAAETVNSLINDFYIAIGEFEDALTKIDPKSSAIDAPAQVEVVAQVAPQVAQQMAQAPVVPVLEKFTLDEGDTLNEEVEEKPELQKELEEPVEKELKEVEKYRKEKVKPSLNPEPEELDESVDDTFDPHFYESLLKLED